MTWIRLLGSYFWFACCDEAPTEDPDPRKVRHTPANVELLPFSTFSGSDSNSVAISCAKFFIFTTATLFTLILIQMKKI